MSVYTIANQNDLVTFMNNSYPEGNVVNNVLLSNNGLVLSNQTHLLKLIISSGNYNIVVGQAPVGNIIFSKNNITDDGYQVGDYVYKDMYVEDYTGRFDPMWYYPQYFPDMAPFDNSNIVEGDKQPSDRLNACYWNDWGDDIFDNWGYFYLYDVTQGKYYFPLFDPVNQADGQLFTQTFVVFGRTFTITQGYPVQGIFKFDITVNDDLPFKFGAYGNMGSDGYEVNTEYAYPYTIGSTNLTLYYLEQAENGSSNEILYTYFIPRKVSENATKTYDLYQNSGNDNNSLMTKTVTSGVIVYFAKTNDVRDWVINDLDVS